MLNKVLDCIDTVQNYVEEVDHHMKGPIIQLLDDLYADIETDVHYKEMVNPNME